MGVGMRTSSASSLFALVALPVECGSCCSDFVRALMVGDPRGATRVLLGRHWLCRTGWVGLLQLIIETQFYQIPYFNSFEYGVPWVTQVRCSAAVTGWISSGSRA